MIERDKIKVGSRVVEDDPDEFGNEPYRGKVKEIKPLGDGKGSYVYVAIVELDKKSMQQDRISIACPQGVMRCFPHCISLDKIASNDGPEL